LSPSSGNHGSSNRNNNSNNNTQNKKLGGINSTKSERDHAHGAVDKRRRTDDASGAQPVKQQRTLFDMLDAPPRQLDKCQQVSVSQLPGEWVRRHAIGKEVKSWSKVYVPLIFSALGKVPESAQGVLRPKLAGREKVSDSAQIERAQEWWKARFSAWPRWVKKVADFIEQHGEASFVTQYIMTPSPRGKTTLVFSDGRGFGWLPHMNGRNQESIMEACEIDGEIAICVAASTAAPRNAT
jgi:hypothetical protein